MRQRDIKMNRYERYKESGIPWLGEVPEHWEIKPLKFSINNISHKVESQLSNLRYFGLENIESFTGRLLLDIELESEGIANEFQENDVLFGKLRPYLAKVHLSRLNGLVSTEALVFRASNAVNPKFLFYFCVSSDFIDAVNGTTFGSKMPRASWDNIGNFRMLIPSLKEQSAIAHFLDTKLGEIDALIEKQQTLLEKLAEQRTAVITHAVTKGLNPAAPMKNSGVEWLGDVPAHWQLINLKFFCRVKGGYAFSSDDFSDEGIPVIRISDILFDGTVDNINCKRIPLELAPNQKDFELRNSQLVMAMTGATIGKISKYCSEDYAYINQRVGKFEAFNSRLNYAFLYHLLNTSGYQEHIKLTAFGGAQPNISDSEMVNYQMVLPTMEEQANIADYLDKETAQIDRLCDTVNQTIDRLKEYRTALITQAVTGKIKVTN